MKMKIPIIGFKTTRRFAAIAILASFIFTNVFAGAALRGDQMNVVSKSAATTKYTTNLTQLGREGRLRANLSFENETARLVKALAEGGVRQPVIVDEDKAVQNTIVEQAALLIAKGSAPASLAGRSILKVETANLFSNARSEADEAQFIDSIVSDAMASKGQTILFVDELTNLVGKGAAKTSFFNAVATGKLVIIGGCSAAAYDERIESQTEIAAFFAAIRVSEKNNNPAKETKSKNADSGFRGDNISPDLREMMAKDPRGRTRVDVIIQAKDADNAALRSLMATGQAHVSDRIGHSDTLVVNLPLSALQTLAASGLINYISPNRSTKGAGFVEDATGTALMRSQTATATRPAYTLNGSGVGIAILDSGIFADHNGFKTGGVSRIVANVDFTNSTTNDLYGHGTHVAGLAAGGD